MPENSLRRKKVISGSGPVLIFHDPPVSDKVFEVPVIFDQTVKDKPVNFTGGGILGKIGLR